MSQPISNLLGKNFTTNTNTNSDGSTRKPAPSDGSNIPTPNIVPINLLSSAVDNSKLSKNFYSTYNPDTPQLSDVNLQQISDISRVKLRDRFYIDMKLRDNVKNGDGYTLGRNDYGLRNFSLDSYVEPNRRLLLNPNNTHMTTPDSYFNGNDKNYYHLDPDAIIERDSNGLIIKSRLDYSYKGKKNQLE